MNNLKRQAKPHGTVCERSQSTDPHPKITQRLLGNTAFPDKFCVMKVPYLILFLLTEVNQQGACVQTKHTAGTLAVHSTYITMGRVTLLFVPSNTEGHGEQERTAETLHPSSVHLAHR